MKNAVTKVSGFKVAACAHSVGMASGTNEQNGNMELVANRGHKRKENKENTDQVVPTCFGSGMEAQSPVIGFDGVQNSWGCLLQDGRGGGGGVLGVCFPDRGCYNMI